MTKGTLRDVTLADLADIPSRFASLQKDHAESLNELAESVHSEFKKVEHRIDTLEDKMIVEFRELNGVIGGMKQDIADIKSLLNGRIDS